jgi:hypothetical protein
LTRRRGGVGRGVLSEKSLFASFSSEKEGGCFLVVDLVVQRRRGIAPYELVVRKASARALVWAV